MDRQIPRELEQCWNDGTRHSNPLIALHATKEFWPLWAQWQAALAREAIADGATWDEIGQAMGISRQAAWGRFKAAVEGGKPMEMEKENERQLREAIKEIKAHGRERDQELAANRRRLRDDLRALDRQRVQERTERQQQIDELRGRLSTTRRNPSADSARQM
ncbi:MAG: hypothetical protein HPY65_13635 [Syntrophaceae bacterium]|nr:hypothetical protein [Syntrophaceae bacterium]